MLLKGGMMNIELPDSIIHFPAKSKRDIKLIASVSEGGDADAHLMYRIASGNFIPILIVHSISSFI